MVPGKEFPHPGNFDFYPGYLAIGWWSFDIALPRDLFISPGVGVLE